MVFLVEFLLLSGFFFFVLTQMLLPTIFGTRMFPVFRRKSATELQQSLARAEESVIDAEIEKRVAERLAAAESIRSSVKQSTTTQTNTKTKGH